MPRSMPMRRTRRSGPGTACPTGLLTSPATRWWRRWTRWASTARSIYPPFSMYQYDASYAVEVQKAHPDKFALVKPVNPDDPAVADVIADWKKTTGTVGIRIIMTKESKRAPDDPGFDRILRAALRNDFPVNILFWGNIDAGTALIDRHSDVRFIIDHLGILQPSVPPPPPQPCADLPKQLELANRKNAAIKVTSASTLPP